MPILTHNVRTRETEHLRLEPITAAHVGDYLTVFNDDAIAEWYAGKPTREEAVADVARIERAWNVLGVHKWLAYEVSSGEVVGRGGLSCMVLGSDVACQVVELLRPAPWLDEAFNPGNGMQLARRWFEIGWALRGAFWGRGYASEIARAGLDYAFEELAARAVVSFTERHNARSRAVMERMGMTYAGEFLSEGLLEGVEGVHPDAPFALYVTTSPE